MNTENLYLSIKTVSTAIVAFISAKLGILFPVLMVLVLMMIADQFSGMWASKKEALDYPNDPKKGWSSTKWRKGIYKKFGYILTIAVAMVVDFLIFNISEKMGIKIPTTTLFGLLTTVWFILNELLSIIENAGRLGAPLPGYLKKIIIVLKTGVEKQGDIASESEVKKYE